MPEKTDATKILTASPWRNGGDHRTPSYYVDTSPLLERSNWCSSELSTLETDVYVWRYTLLVVHVSN